MNLVSVSLGQIEFITEIPNEHISQINDAISNTNKFETALIPYFTYKISIDDLNNFLNENKKEHIENPWSTEQNSIRLYSTMRLRTAQVLLAFGLYVEHCDAHIKSILGRNHPAATSFRKQKEILLKRSFWYNFLLRLRNYAAHVEYPVSDMSFTITPSQKPYSTNIRLLISSKKIIEKTRDLPISAKSASRFLPDELEFFRIVGKADRIVKRLHGITFNGFLGTYRDNLQYMVDYVGPYIQTDKKLALVDSENMKKLERSHLSHEKVHFKEIPTHFIGILINFLKTSYEKEG